MSEVAPFTVGQAASVEAKLFELYHQLSKDEKPVVEAILNQAFSKIDGPVLDMTDLGWTFYPNYVGGFAFGSGLRMTKEPKATESAIADCEIDHSLPCKLLDTGPLPGVHQPNDSGRCHTCDG